MTLLATKSMNTTAAIIFAHWFKQNVKKVMKSKTNHSVFGPMASVTEHPCGSKSAMVRLVDLP